jgi:hypothetical protein
LPPGPPPGVMPHGPSRGRAAGHSRTRKARRRLSSRTHFRPPLDCVAAPSPSPLLAAKGHSSFTKSAATCANRSGVPKLVRLCARGNFLLAAQEPCFSPSPFSYPLNCLKKCFILHQISRGLRQSIRHNMIYPATQNLQGGGLAPARARAIAREERAVGVSLN